jgi:UDP-N-acetyl-D-galactosamine dehydrogenase
MMPTLLGLTAKQEAIAVIGLGNVGLALAVLLTKRYAVIGYDRDIQRRCELKVNFDRNWQFSGAELENASIKIVESVSECAAARVFILTVSTGIAADGSPDLDALKQACRDVGCSVSRDALIIVESTVPPGATENICIPLIAESSKLTPNESLFYGYSPERINIGDRDHTIPNVIKVISGGNLSALELIDDIYRSVIPAGTYRCGSVIAAEMCKLLENAQRDINIAFANAMARLCHSYSTETREVFAAAGTKWNALQFRPGLVGGGCIAMATSYLNHAASEKGLECGILSSARDENDNVERFINMQLQNLLSNMLSKPSVQRILILGVAFKPNVSSVVNSRAIPLIKHLQRLGYIVDAVDPYVDQQKIIITHQINMIPFASMGKADAIIAIVNHRCFGAIGKDDLLQILDQKGIIIDLAGVWNREAIEKLGMTFWSL